MTWCRLKAEGHTGKLGLVGRFADYNADKPLTLSHKDAEHHEKVQQYQKHSPFKKKKWTFEILQKFYFSLTNDESHVILLITIINSSATALQHYAR